MTTKLAKFHKFTESFFGKTDSAKVLAAEFISSLPEGSFIAITAETNVMSGISTSTAICVWYWSKR